ncbi:hypothetical protein KA089_00115 [Candidatus Woesebacteria bacterium]|nr:hypothetical protein [Candidatus Woesebacteria bacterium]
MSTIELEATITCPECNTKQKVFMPTQGQQHFFKCGNEQCAFDISTKEGDCCVFCSYSDKKCPYQQSIPEGSKVLQSLI